MHPSSRQSAQLHRPPYYSQPYHTSQPDSQSSVQPQHQLPSFAPNQTGFSRENSDSKLQNQLEIGLHVSQLVDKQIKAAKDGRIQEAFELSSQCDQRMAQYKKASDFLMTELEAGRSEAATLLARCSPHRMSNPDSGPMPQHTTQHTVASHPSDLSTNSRVNEGTVASATYLTHPHPHPQTLNTATDALSRSVSSGHRQWPQVSRNNRQATGTDEYAGRTNVGADLGPPAGGSTETNVGQLSVTLQWACGGTEHYTRVRAVEIIGDP
jgi:hypothetical protein